MKKFMLFLILLFVFITPISAEDLTLNAKSSILIEASTGKILYEKNKDERYAPASMTKMMSLVIIMDNIYNGNLRLDEMIKTSKNASGMGGSQIFLKEGIYIWIITLENTCLLTATAAVPTPWKIPKPLSRP